jgi:hypothetical protein
MEFFANLVHALTSPVNCAGNLLINVTGDVVQFGQCVWTNLSSIV